MRLLRRRPATLPEGWVAPAASTDPPIVLGTLDGDARPTVDRTGRLTFAGGWGLDWWVGAADRWHVPATERATAVAQRRIDGSPVVETTVRIPGGHAVHRTWCVRLGDVDWAVVELENRSREAVAVALAVRPFARVVAYEGTTVDVDGDLVVLGRAPAHAVLGTAATGDVADAVLASAVSSGAPPAATTCRSRLAHGAFVFPLAHTATLRAAVRLDPAAGAVDPWALPDAATVARGWLAHLDAGVRVALPDDVQAERVRAARCDALLSPGPTTLGALDRWGHAAAASLAFDALVTAGGPRSVHEAAAAARHALLAADPSLLEPILVPLAAAAHRAGSSAPRAVATVAAALDLADQPDAAAACRALLADGHVARTGADRPPGFLEAFGAALVDDGDVPGEIRLVPSWPDSWLGRDLEVHGAPTLAGPVSFAVRWHGARPAVLWETGGAARSITASGLDPSWSTSEPAGDALLSPIAPPGLPGVVGPLGGAGTPAGEAGDSGTFS